MLSKELEYLLQIQAEVDELKDQVDEIVNICLQTMYDEAGGNDE